MWNLVQDRQHSWEATPAASSDNTNRTLFVDATPQGAGHDCPAQGREPIYAGINHPAYTVERFEIDNSL